MTLGAALNRLNRHTLGELANPTAETQAAYIDAINEAQEVWANTTGVQWDELLDYWRTPLTTSNAYQLPDFVKHVSTARLDAVSIEWVQGGNNIREEYQIIEPDRFKVLAGAGNTEKKICAIIRNRLVFAAPFKSTDVRIGLNAEIAVPYYAQPTLLTADDLEAQIQCPDINFVLFHAASELVSEGFVKEERLQEFITRAADRLDYMVERNRARKKSILSPTWRPPSRPTSFI